MKGFNFFKNYRTKTDFNFETKEFQERRVQQDDFDQPEQLNQLDAQAPLALTFLMVGLTPPNKRKPKY